MAFADFSILVSLKNKLSWHRARQGILAQNIANANTPNYQPRDLKRVDFSALVAQTTGNSSGITTLTTHAAHFRISGFGEQGVSFDVKKGVDWEITPNGNAVSLEDQMIKVTENQMEYQAATTLYSRSLGLLRLTVGKN